MKTRVHVMGCFLALILCLLMPGASAAAEATVTEFTAYEFACSSTVNEEWISGNTLHRRGQIDVGNIVSSEPLIQGEQVSDIDFSLNLATGQGAYHIRAVLTPTAVSGTWEILWRGKWFKHGLILAGKGTGHGTGDLAGQHMFVDIHYIEVDAALLEELGGNPCPGAPDLGVYLWTGRMLDP